MADPDNEETESVETETSTEVTADETSAVESESTVNPAAELKTQFDAEREQRIRLEERLAAQSQQPPAKPVEEPKTFSRQQLRAAVHEGSIDEDQLEEIWAKQQREIAKRETVQLLEEREASSRAANFVEDETAKYIAAFPEVQNTGSDTWNRVKREYDFMVRLGDPDNKATELKALRAALGSHERIRESTSKRRETSGETSGGSNTGGARPVDIFNRIPQQYRSYYKKRYEEGSMTIEDIKKDLPYMARTT